MITRTIARRRRTAARSAGQMCLAYVADKILHDADAVGKPCQFLVGYFVVRRVACIDIGRPSNSKPRCSKRVVRGHATISDGAMRSACERRKFSL